MKQADTQARVSKRTLIFHGTREEALQRLPSLCPTERLELGPRHVSLVTDDQRLDMQFRLEARYSTPERIGSIIKLEFWFTGHAEDVLDQFMYHFCHGGDRVLH